MNCKQAKEIPIQDFLEAMGFTPARTNRNGLWYHSPLLGEGEDRTPSFQVSPDGRGFYDWSCGAKGNILDLAMLMLGTRNVPEALRFIEKATAGHVPSYKRTPSSGEKGNNVWEDVTIEPLHSGALCSYLYRRGISWETAKKYCVEVRYYRPGRRTEYYAVGFQNRSGGYELRNPHFKGSMAPKDITVIGNVWNSKCLVLEGFMDFLSIVDMGWFAEENMSAIVLNSTALVDRCLPELKEALEVVCLLDNDESGRKTTEKLCATLPQAYDSSLLFTQQGYHDVNDLARALLLMNNFYNKPKS